MSEFAGKQAVVLGAGETGIASALLLKSRDARVFVSEIRPPGALPVARSVFQSAGIECEFGRHSWDRLRQSDLAILSPGIPPASETYQRLKGFGCPVWSDIELAYRCTTAEIIAVTGTNGKTTVTTLIRDVLRAGGRSAVSCGNIGPSFARVAGELDPSTLVVLEVSSFQLSHVQMFRPHVAVLLNLSVNHLDWHGSYDDYVDAKCRIFGNQTRADYALVNGSDVECRKRAGHLAAQVLYFDERGGKNPNEAAVRKVAELYQVDPVKVHSVFERFAGLEHRLEDIGMVRGVRYINDSKSTTLASLAWALREVGPNTVLILGGRHKGGDFRNLLPQIQEKVKHMIVLGESKALIQHAFGGCVSVEEVQTLRDAVQAAARFSRPGDTVLLSPACASLDQFRDYQDRGAQFKSLVANRREALTPTVSE